MSGLTQEVIQGLFLERIDEIGGEVLMQNEEYQNVMEKANALLHQIKAVLPDEHKQLAQELDSLISQQQAIAEEVMYGQGVKDGAVLKHILVA